MPVPEDGDVGGGHRSHPRQPALGVSHKGRAQEPEVPHSIVPGHHHHDVAGTGLNVLSELCRAMLGRPGHEMAIEGLGGYPVEIGQPLCAVGPGLALSADAHENHHGGLDRIGAIDRLHGLSAQRAAPLSRSRRP